jgi:hypothetical protein
MLAVAGALVVAVGVTPASAASIDVKRNDYNGDGISDILAIDLDDCTIVWNGNGSGGFGDAHGGLCLPSFTNFRSFAAVGDINGDRIGDFVALADDTLYRFAGTGFNNFRSLGTGPGWGAINDLVGVGDITGDGVGDMVGFSTAANGVETMHRYKGGSGSFTYLGPWGGGWQSYGRYAGVGDINGNGRGDLVAVGAGGILHRWFGTTSGGFTYGGSFGGGWNNYSSLAGMGNIGGTSAGDLLGLNGDFQLWRWTGNGSGAFNPGQLAKDVLFFFGAGRGIE